MRISGKAIAIVGVLAIGGIAVYLYLKRTPTNASAPTPHPLRDTVPPSIFESHLGIHGDDPSAVKGDLLPTGRFSITTTENAPAVDVFFFRKTTGQPIAPRTGPRPT